jgi:glycosyltransferase involved in cell wall biosynthesis
VPNPFWEDGRVPFVGQNELGEIVAEFRPDVLHSHEAALLGLQLLRLKRETGLPLLATCYHVPRFAARYLTWRDEPQEAVESLFWAYSTWFFDQADRVVFATESHRSSFQENGLDVSTTIISNGVDTTRYHPQVSGIAAAEARYDLPPGQRILFVSRLAKDKEIDILIRAMGRVSQQLPAHLLIVGDGDDRDRLDDLTKELRLEHCVRFLGYIPEEDLPILYRAANLFAIASTCEVQSLPTLQAVATGLPVVAAEAMALPELVDNGINGFLVTPGDVQGMAAAMIRILGDPALAARMGEASLAIAQPHEETHTFDLYEAAYQELKGWQSSSTLLTGTHERTT